MARNKELYYHIIGAPEGVTDLPRGILGSDAVNVDQLNDAIADIDVDLSDYYTKVESDDKYIFADPTTPQAASIDITGNIRVFSDVDRFLQLNSNSLEFGTNQGIIFHTAGTVTYIAEAQHIFNIDGESLFNIRAGGIMRNTDGKFALFEGDLDGYFIKASPDVPQVADINITGDALVGGIYAPNAHLGGGGEGIILEGYGAGIRVAGNDPTIQIDDELGETTEAYKFLVHEQGSTGKVKVLTNPPFAPISPSDGGYIFASPTEAQSESIWLNGNIEALNVDFFNTKTRTLSVTVETEGVGSISSYLDSQCAAWVFSDGIDKQAVIRFQPEAYPSINGRVRLMVNEDAANNTSIIAYLEDLVDYAPVSPSGDYVQASPETPQAVYIAISGTVTAGSLTVSGNGISILDAVNIFAGGSGIAAYDTEAYHRFTVNGAEGFTLRSNEIYRSSDGAKALFEGDAIQANPSAPQVANADITGHLIVRDTTNKPYYIENSFNESIGEESFTIGDGAASAMYLYENQLYDFGGTRYLKEGDIGDGFILVSPDDPQVANIDITGTIASGLIFSRGLTSAGDPYVKTYFDNNTAQIRLGVDGEEGFISFTPSYGDLRLRWNDNPIAYLSDITGGGSSYSFSKGLGESAGAVTLGGDYTGSIVVGNPVADKSTLVIDASTGIGLLQGNITSGPFATIIAEDDGVGKKVTFGLGTSGVFEEGFIINSLGAVFKDTVNSRGIEYFADYSANFTTRSLVDKGYVDGLFAGSGTGSVTSVALTVPTGLTITSGSPITTSGTIAVDLQSGYSIPTITKQGQWDTAYGWGDHSVAGYQLVSNLQANLTASASKYPSVNAVNTGLGLKANLAGGNTFGGVQKTDQYWSTLVPSTGTQDVSKLSLTLNVGASRAVGTLNLNTTSLDGATAITTGLLQAPAAQTSNWVWTMPNKTGTLATLADITGGGVTSVDLSAPTGFAVSGNPVTTTGTLVLSFASGYSLPSDATQATWTAKEPAVTAGTTDQYYRGDKTWASALFYPQPTEFTGGGTSTSDYFSLLTVPVSKGGTGATANTGSGNNVLATSPTLVTPVLGAATGTSLQLSGLTASQSVQTDASKNLVSVANTGTGSNVLAASPTFTGAPLAPTPGTNINTTQIPTTAWTNTYYAAKASPTFTGTPLSTTAAAGTNTTQIATTAFVQNAVTSPVVDIVNTTVVNAVSGTKYYANHAGLSTLLLPTTAAKGSQILMRGQGTGGWKITQNASQKIHGASDSTSGTTGSLASQTQYDTVVLECMVANLEWIIVANRGTLTIA